jgi:hypothetical protein
MLLSIKIESAEMYVQYITVYVHVHVFVHFNVNGKITYNCP